MVSPKDFSLEARLFVSLVRDSDWIQRRVERFSLLDLNSVERSVSLDIDSYEVRKRLGDIAEDADCDGKELVGEIYIPLTFFEKGVLFDLDVVGSDGRSLSVLATERQVKIELEALRLILLDNGVDIDGLPSAVVHRIETLVHSRGRNSSVHSRPDFDDSAENVAAWESLLRVEQFSVALSRFTHSSPMIALVDCSSDSTVVKYRYTEPLRPQDEPTLLERMGLRAYAYAPEIPSIGSARRCIYRFDPPRGMSVASVGVAGTPDSRQELSDDQIVTQPWRYRYRYRTALHGSVVSTENMIPAKYALLVRLSPRVSSLFVPGFLTLALTNVLLIVFGLRVMDPLFGPLVRNVFANSADINSIVTLLALIPSLVAIYVASSGEHGLVRRLLTFPRLALFVTAMLTVGLAFVYALGLRGAALEVCYVAAVAVSFATMLLLAVSSVRFTVMRHRVRQAAHGTSETWVIYLLQ